MEQYLKNLELIMTTEKYSLYIDRKSNEVSIYNGDDIWTIGVNELGNLGFK
ncbi:hypothetical protein [Bacillus sp. ISL-57]|uniref:hypothetical protein n=1 Tax=Bacillus sp. ISL-57 TaxID=2819135 RepID=UPI001BEB6D14|nr:hypothetical protein [Bacillus sp. ISL-57]MBT2718286.1 hypothetical protein [Bacillus sp. ISL-57]